MSTGPYPVASLTAAVAEEVRAHLARRRMSGRELARRLGVSPQWVSQRTRGVVSMSIDDLEAVAWVLGVPVSAFLPAAISSVPDPDNGPVRRATVLYRANRCTSPLVRPLRPGDATVTETRLRGHRCDRLTAA